MGAFRYPLQRTTPACAKSPEDTVRMISFDKIAIVGRYEANDLVIDSINHLYRFLQDLGKDILLDEKAAEVIKEDGAAGMSYEALGDVADLAIVVGGDGSMLTAARSFAQHNLPVVGINRGGLGFLTDIAPDEIVAKLGEVFAGHYITESRFLLSAKQGLISGEGRCGQALNDVVLSSGLSGRMIEFELYIDDQFVYSQRSNGLIVSTPTGSTAYALSGGGPIMHPSLDAIVLVPILPHTLTGRPIVVDGNSRIKIIPGSLHDTSPLVSCDGHSNFSLDPGDELCVSKLRDSLTLIHPLPHDFYERCRSKLDWGSRLGN